MRRQDGTVSRKLRDAIPTCVASSSGAVLALILLVAADTHNPIPSTPGTSFFSQVTTFLSNEDAQRYGDQFAGFVFTPTNGATHSTNPASLTATPVTWSGYTNGGWYLANVTGSVTYQDGSTCWLIAHQGTTGNLGSFTRAGSTHYLTDCRASIGDPPELPANSLPLLMVVTAGGGIASVTDMRPLGGPGGWVDALDYESIEAAVTAVGGTYPTTLLVRSRVQVSSGLVIPRNVRLAIPQGGLLEVVSGASITFGISPDAGRYQIFTTGSVVVFQAYVEVYPEWWGAVAGDSTSDTTAIRAAVTALPWAASSCGASTSPCGGLVSLGAGNYILGTTLEINSGATPTTLRGEIILKGQSQRATILSYTGGATAIILAGIDSSNVASQIVLQGFTLFDSGAIGLRGISLEYLSNVRITDVRVNNFYSLNPGVRGLEGTDTGGSQNVNIAGEGYAIRGQNTSNVQVDHSTFINDNIGFYCETTCENTLIGPENVFNSADGADNAAIAFIGPTSRARIEKNFFQNGIADSEGEVFVWSVDSVDIVGNYFQGGDADHFVYVNALTTSGATHQVNVEDNYFAVGEFGDTGATLNLGAMYFRNTSSGRIVGNALEGSSLYQDSDIVLSDNTGSFVIEGNDAFLGSAAIGSYAGGSSRPLSVTDGRGAAIVQGNGVAVGQAPNPGIFAPGSLVTKDGGFQEGGRWNYATQGSFENGTASLTSVGAVVLSVSATGWHSDEGVSIQFPLAATTSTDRVEFDNTSVSCVIGDYFMVSFAAMNSSGATAQRNDITFQMAGSEILGQFVPQLDTTWNRYWFMTSRCLAAGTVELWAFQNTAQSAALTLSVDAIQIERNVETPGAFVPTYSLIAAAEGFVLSRGGMVLPARIQSISGDVTFTQGDGLVLFYTNTGATTRSVTPSGNFPVGHTLIVSNAAASAGAIRFNAGDVRILRPNTNMMVVWNGSAWIRVAESGTFSYTRTLLVAAEATVNHVDGEIVYCTDCNSDATCTAGGPGSIAIHEAGVWTCQK